MSDARDEADGTTASERVDFRVPDMDCPSCASKVTASVERLERGIEVDAWPTTGVLRVSYDPEHASHEGVVERIEAAGYAVENPATDRTELSESNRTETLSVPEMDCPSCASKVGRALDGLDEHIEYDLRPTTGEVRVTYDHGTTTRASITDAVASAGYEVTNAEAETGPGVEGGTGTGAEGGAGGESVWRSSRARKTAVAAAFLALGIGIGLFGGQDLSVPGLPGALSLADAFMLVAVVTGGEVILRNGYYSAKNFSLDIDFLMSAAIVGATAVSLFTGASLYVEAASLAVLFNVAELLERYSVDRARNSLTELMELSPDTAVVRRDGEETQLPVEEVAVGDVVVVEPGTKIPMDGTVVEGNSAVDQSPITGESIPVDKTAGDEVYAGTVNESGYLEAEVTARAADNTLSRVIEMVEDAQSRKTDREQFVERFAGYYTPVVTAAAILTALVPPLLLGGAWTTWFVRGITLLVLACPCAFVISTPVSVVSGITSAAKNGVLIKGGDHLEAMGDVEAIAFDKTGTLTKGDLAVTEVLALNGNTESDVLQCARGLEARSEHPVAEAIVERAESRGVDGRAIDDFGSITGKGVRADLDGVTHYAGKPALFRELGFDLDHVHLTDGGIATQEATSRCGDRDDCLDLVAETIPRLQNEGKTIVLVGTDEELEGVIAIADEVRPDARFAVDTLREAGLRTVMLTGDNEGTAEAVAAAVGVDDYRAELLPEDKVDAIEDLMGEYGTVAMVGDGINDAPAMATASVGIAMGAAGTDTAIETADIALMADDLSKLPYLHRLSERANGVIRTNVWASLGTKALLAIGVPFGLVSVVLAVLAGDVGMTTLVTANAMRLSRVTPDAIDGASSADEGSTTVDPAP